MNRYKPTGWKYESNRHSLAAKGISTRDERYWDFLSEKIRVKESTMPKKEKDIVIEKLEKDYADGEEHTKAAFASKDIYIKVCEHDELGVPEREGNPMLALMRESWDDITAKKPELEEYNPISSSIKDSAQQWLSFSSKDKDHIKGGIADDIPDSRFSQEELRQGQRVEMEHTNNPYIAKEIAKDHIAEFPHSGYYPELEKMERKLKYNEENYNE